jgi:3'-phosphoadenosine 5'-phosphosulfate sulfotransferase (PAPS reductase)/FAD synthetase
VTEQSPHERIGKRRVLASVSGGKDSAAMCLHLRELGVEFDAAFIDTGWESDITYDYIRGELTDAIGPIHWLRGERTFEELVRWKGMFPSRTRRFCTQFLKVFPMQKYIAGLDYDVVNAVGVRAAESVARAQLPEWEWADGFDCEVWRPLIRWSEADVIAIHQRHGLRPNPLYLLGARRVGCYPCIYSNKAEIRRIADTDPERIVRIRKLEGEVVDAARLRAESRGETLERPPAFFRLHARDEANNGFVAIDRVVQWARTSRGGRQQDMFAQEAPDAGCMRWGLCETEEPAA